MIGTKNGFIDNVSAGQLHRTVLQPNFAQEELQKYPVLNVSGSPLYSRKSMATTPVQMNFFNGAPGTYTGNYDADGKLGDFFMVITAIKIVVGNIVVTNTHLDFAKICMGSFFTLKVNNKEWWKRIPGHLLISTPQVDLFSNITAAATETWTKINDNGANFGSVIPYAPNTKFELILDPDTTILGAVAAAINFDAMVYGPRWLPQSAG
jgi:hypothetical protein